MDGFSYIIVPDTTPGVLAAKQATRTIPIVMLAPGDPVGTGLVDSLTRVVVLTNLADPVATPQLQELEAATGCGAGFGKRTRDTLGVSLPIGSHYV